MDNEPTLAKVQLTDGLGPADETHHLPTPKDLRSYADDADQHGNHWVPIAPASLRGLAAEIERLQATLKLQQASYEREIALDVAAERERWTLLFAEKWHAGDGKGQTLAQYMGMTDAEYAAWVLKA